MKKFLVAGPVAASLLLASSLSWASQIDILVDKLVEKGILTPVEAQIILDETKQEIAKEIAQGKADGIPSWVQKTKVKGDVRLRFQKEEKDSDTDADKEFRYRVRLGVESKVTDTVKVGLGFATAGSSGDPRSRNQTFKDTFDTNSVEWDYAFAEWQANNNLKVIGGKFKRKPYLWAPTDMLWDGDITPEGASANWTAELTEHSDYWINGGLWILDENGHADAVDPFMKLVQGGIKYKKDKVDAKFATTFYDFEGIEDITLANDKATQGSNNTVTGSTYRTISPAVEVGVKEMFGGLPFNIDQRVAVFGEFVHNLDDSTITDELNGWSFGVKFGHKKVKKKGNWQIKYIKTDLQRDAWLDLLPDSDRFGGNTGIEAHEVAFKYALSKNVIFGLDYYKSWATSDDDNKQDLVQADLVFKF